MAAKKILYNGTWYTKHPNQKYYYCAQSKKQYSRCLHRQMWFDANGEIPKGMQLHHKDGDAYNNTLANFELVNRSDHARMHVQERFKNDPEYFKRFHEKGIAAAAEWHRSDKGQEWHNGHGKRVGFGHFTYGNKNCEQCGKEFLKKNANARFCHNNCKSAWRRANNPDIIVAECEKCKNEFKTQKYQARRFCSRKCRPAPNPYGSKGCQNDL